MYDVMVYRIMISQQYVNKKIWYHDSQLQGLNILNGMWSDDTGKSPSLLTSWDCTDTDAVYLYLAPVPLYEGGSP